MFSNCSGPCEECSIHYTGGCLAGNGDDDFYQITLEQAKRIVSNEHVDKWGKDKLVEKFPELKKDKEKSSKK